jgi:hypothetical protein
LNYIAEVADRIRREAPPEILPEDDTDLLFLIYATLALKIGESVRAEDVHDTWSAWMTYRDPSHESIKPCAQLSPEMKKTGRPFVDAIRSQRSFLSEEQSAVHSLLYLILRAEFIANSSPLVLMVQGSLKKCLT